jgi:hypothetical protein
LISKFIYIEIVAPIIIYGSRYIEEGIIFLQFMTQMDGFQISAQSGRHSTNFDRFGPIRTELVKNCIIQCEYETKLSGIIVSDAAFEIPFQVIIFKWE